MRFAVEAWAPEYGGSVEEAALAPSEQLADPEVELALADWRPLRPTVAPASAVLFVDGVRRVEARVWVVDDTGTTHQGIVASYAAGAMRADGQAALVGWEVRRSLFCPAAGDEPIETRHGRFCPVAVSDDDPSQLSLCLQRKMGDLEVGVATDAARRHPGELIVVDGPLRQHRLVPGAVGYIKTLHRSYGPPVVLDVARRLGPGERTPLMVVGEGFTRYSWYVRLPELGGPAHPLAGLVRCEAPADIVRAEVVALADRVTATLPRFASRPHKDTRAPQNLYPIAGLERELRRRLGDPAVLYRALRSAAAAAA